MRTWAALQRCVVIRRILSSARRWGYSFGDFIANTGVMVAISLIFVVLYLYLYFRKELKSTKVGAAESI